MPDKQIDFNHIAKKWQAKWEENKIFKVKEDSKKKKFYCLEMYRISSTHITNPIIIMAFSHMYNLSINLND